MSAVAKFEKEIAEQEQDEANAPIPFNPTAVSDNAHEPEGGDNSSDYNGAAKLIEKIEKEQAEIDRINAEAMDEKASHRDEIAPLRKAIRDDHSIEAKALSAILTKRRQDRRMKERIAALEEPAKGQFEQLEMAL